MGTLSTDEKSNIWTKIGMIGFMFFIIVFVSFSSWIYFNNNNNVAIRIQTDNEVNKEKTAVNEALTKTLVLKNDSITSYKTEVKKKDSLLINEIKYFKQELEKEKHEKDSLVNILRHFKQSDIQPVRKSTN